jgi:hypothetical protein
MRNYTERIKIADNLKSFNWKIFSYFLGFSKYLLENNKAEMFCMSEKFCYEFSFQQDTHEAGCCSQSIA